MGGFLLRAMQNPTGGPFLFSEAHSGGVISLDDLRKRVLYVALGRCLSDSQALRVRSAYSPEAFLRSIVRELSLSERLVNEEMVEEFDSMASMMRMGHLGNFHRDLPYPCGEDDCG